jgi:hypothetical protein
MTVTKQNKPEIAVFQNFNNARDHGSKFGKGYSQWRVTNYSHGFAVLLMKHSGKNIYLTEHGAPFTK